MIYQKPTVMAYYQIKNICPSASQWQLPAYPLPLSPPALGLPKKGWQSVTHYMNSQLPPCINHRRRRAPFIVHVEQDLPLHFCQKCKETLENQGFSCQSIEEFDGSTPQQQNIIPHSHKQRRNGIDCFLLSIKALHQRATRFQPSFEEIIQQELSKNSRHMATLFEDLGAEISALRRSYNELMQRNAQHILNFYKQIRCSLTWTQEELQYLISRITKNMDRLILDQQFYALNIKILSESLNEKERKVAVAEQAYLHHCQQFKLQNDMITQQITKKAQKVTQIINSSCEISGIASLESLGAEEERTCREIVGEMSTNHTLT